MLLFVVQAGGRAFLFPEGTIRQNIFEDLMRISLALVLLVGCSDPAPSPEAARGPTADPDLEKVRDALSGARTLRLRFKGEWPYAVGRMAKNVTGILLLGEGARAKISQTLSYAPGSGTTFEAVSD